MNAKINLFTALIIVYSIVVCTIFKKSDDLSTQSANVIQTNNFPIAKANGNNITKEVITASLKLAQKDMPQ